MIPTLFLFLIPIMTVWSGGVDIGYSSHIVFISDDLPNVCNHEMARGCVIEVNGRSAIVLENPFEFARTGCNVLTHEWWHLMGYSERFIPQCNP